MEEDDITIPSSSTSTNETKTNTLETPLEMYTRLLESTPEPNSITIISLGFLTNLATLLTSNTSSSGYELVQQKVHEIIIMGGTYPGPGWEFNFGEFPLETKTVLENFPSNVQVTFSGFELGGVVFSGGGLKKRCDDDDEEERDNSPIRAAYEWYVGRCSTLRESWDPITTLYGILGLKGGNPLNGGDELFEYGNAGGGGYNKIVESNGTNLWIDDDGQQHNQRWLKLAEGVSNVTLAEILDGFYTHGPGGCELF